MATGGEIELPEFWQKHKDVPVASLSNSACNILNLNLSPSVLGTTSDTGLKPNWEGFAELCLYSAQEIRLFDRDKEPMLRVLEKWSHRKDSTLGKLAQFLIVLECDGLLLEKTFQAAIERGVESYHAYQRNQHDSPDTGHVSLHVVRSDPSPSIHVEEQRHDPDAGIDVASVKSGKTVIYDAFVCYAKEDLPFVAQLVSRMEKEKRCDGLNLKLCVGERDLIAGTAENTVTAKMIKDRCYRVILVLSNNFLRSPQCDFQLKFAQHLSPGCRSKKLIPILIEDVQIPNILSFITRVDFVKKDLIDWNWDRLAASVMAPFYLTPEENKDVGDLSLIKLDIDNSESSSDPLPPIPSSSSSPLPSIPSSSRLPPISTSSSSTHITSSSSLPAIIPIPRDSKVPSLSSSASSLHGGRPIKVTKTSKNKKDRLNAVHGGKSSENGLCTVRNDPLCQSEPSERDTLIGHLTKTESSSAHGETGAAVVQLVDMDGKLPRDTSVSEPTLFARDSAITRDCSTQSLPSARATSRFNRFKRIFKKETS